MAVNNEIERKYLVKDTCFLKENFISETNKSDVKDDSDNEDNI